MSKSKTNSQDLKTQERRLFVLSLRKAGAKYHDIVDAVKVRFKPEELPKNYDVRQAWQDIKRELDKLKSDVEETAEEIRTIEAQRLENIFLGHFQKAIKGDTRHAELCLKIHDRIMKLHGLDITKIAETDSEGNDINFADRLLRKRQIAGSDIIQDQDKSAI